jgi:flavin reductase (DIM6/NTAB) family NADH-FMN oxidoreductase RutF
MALVSLDRGSHLLPPVRKTGRFLVNVLGADQASLARAFGKKGGPGSLPACRGKSITPSHVFQEHRG